jgi:hypothetical protein
VRVARYYEPLSQFEHAGSEGLGCQPCILRGSLANARSRLRMTKLVVGGDTSHGYQDGSGAGAAVRPRSPAARGVERDNCRDRFGIAHSVRVIASVARMSLCDIRGYATAFPGFRKRSSGLRRGIAHSGAAGVVDGGRRMRRPYEVRGPSRGFAPRRVASHRVHGYLRVGRLPSAASVAFGRGGGRAVEPGSNREPSRWLPPSRRNCLW